MQIKRIEISNFKKLSGPLVIEGLTKGINIISGDNEEGKSTILQAIRAAFFQKHSTTGQSVKVFQPYNSTVRPEIRIDFELTKKKYKIAKGFCVKPMFAEFHSPTSIFQGAEAEERIRELFLLNVSDKTKKSGDTESGMWGLLWLDQATAERGLQTTDTGREGLAKILENDVATVIGGNQGRALLKAIEAEYLQLYTAATGKERGVLKEAREKLSSTSSSYVDCYARHERYEKQLIELSKKQEQLDKYKREKTLESARRELEKVIESGQEFSRLKLEVETIKQLENVARMEVEAANKTIAREDELNVQLKKCDELLQSLGAAAETNKQQLDIAQAAANEISQTLQIKEKELSQLEIHYSQAEQQELLEQLEGQFRAVVEQIDKVHSLEASLDQLINKQRALKISRDVLDNLRFLTSEKLKAETRLDSIVTKLVTLPERSNIARIDGNSVEPGTAIKIVAPTTLDLPGWGKLEITPGGNDAQDLAEQAEICSQGLQAALLAAGVSSIEEAQSKLDERSKITIEMDTIRNTIAQLSGKDSGTQLDQKKAYLEKELIEAEKKCVKFKSGGTTLTKVSLAELRATRVSQLEALKSIRQKAEFNGRTVSKLQVDSARVTAEKESSEKNRLKLSEELQLIKSASESAKSSRLQSEQKLRAVQHDFKIKNEALETLRGAQLEKQQELIKRNVAEVESSIKNLTDSITQLSADINAAGQGGLGEELEKLEGSKSIAEQQLQRLERRASATKLLYETLVEAEREAKEHFLEPVAQKLRPHLISLFSEAGMTIDTKSIEIIDIERNGLRENFESLSVGTREQLSVLTRLAVAELLHEKGHPSLVILDDALVYSDEKRLKKMKEILVRLSSEIQVIILTCRPSDYDDVVSAKRLALKGSRIDASKVKKSGSEQLKLL